MWQEKCFPFLLRVSVCTPFSLLLLVKNREKKKKKKVAEKKCILVAASTHVRTSYIYIHMIWIFSPFQKHVFHVQVMYVVVVVVDWLSYIHIYTFPKTRMYIPWSQQVCSSELVFIHTISKNTYAALALVVNWLHTDLSYAGKREKEEYFVVASKHKTSQLDEKNTRRAPR